MTATDQMPDFISIGAARAGTTALYEALKDHPEICLSAAKETNYFAYKDLDLQIKGPGADFINNATTRLEDYKALFAAAKQGQTLGEICPLYLFEPAAPKNIHAAVPHAKLIVTLRNPIDQAYSHFQYARHHAIEPEPDFLRALDLEETRLAQDWQPLFGYSRFPRYAEQLERYLKLFPRDQILILDYGDFRSDRDAYLAQICRFIGVDDSYRPDVGGAVNTGSAPKNWILQELIMRPNVLTAPARVLPFAWRRKIRDLLARQNAGGRERMPEAARTILHDRLAGDIAALSVLLDRDFSHWLD